MQGGLWGERSRLSDWSTERGGECGEEEAACSEQYSERERRSNHRAVFIVVAATMDGAGDSGSRMKEVVSVTLASEEVLSNSNPVE